jgi:hypothetical protein
MYLYRFIMRCFDLMDKVFEYLTPAALVLFFVIVQVFGLIAGTEWIISLVNALTSHPDGLQNWVLRIMLYIAYAIIMLNIGTWYLSNRREEALETEVDQEVIEAK